MTSGAKHPQRAPPPNLPTYGSSLHQKRVPATRAPSPASISFAKPAPHLYEPPRPRFPGVCVPAVTAAAARVYLCPVGGLPRRIIPPPLCPPLVWIPVAQQQWHSLPAPHDSVQERPADRRSGPCLTQHLHLKNDGTSPAAQAVGGDTSTRTARKLQSAAPGPADTHTQDPEAPSGA